VSVCVCVRACVRACVRVRVRVCVYAPVTQLEQPRVHAQLTSVFPAFHHASCTHSANATPRRERAHVRLVDHA
jgi:hypothetical protein